MIERPDGPPGNLAVAIGAFFTELTFVRFVRLMAIDAERRRIAIGRGRFMAPLATRCPVRSFESEVSEGVIEGFPVERGNVRLASFMLGVAMFAFRIDDIRPASMKTLPRLPVGRDLLMTIHAQLALSGL